MGIAACSALPMDLSTRSTIPVARKTDYSKTGRIDTAAAALNCDSQAVQRRLDRIADNYLLLDELLADLEARMPAAIPGEPSGSPGRPR